MMKKTKIFLWSSFIGLIILCIIMFVFVAVVMSGKSNDAISQIGTLYMSEMSEQIEQKFDVVIDMRIMQLKEIVENNPVDTLIDEEEKVYELSRSARVRGFDFLGLYTEEGDYETVYGKDVQPYDPETFNRVLEDKDKRVFSGFNEDGEKMLLVMIAAEYPMADGGTSSAMVAGLPMEYLDQALALDEENTLMYSHIIRRDGTFVIQNREVDYFTRIAELFTEVDGKTAEQYASEIQAAIENDADYSATIKADGSYRHVLCTHLPDSEWYLVSVLPFGALDETVNSLGTQRQIIILLACGVVLVGVLIIFVLYYRASQKQLKTLDAVSKEAVRANRAKSDFLSNMSHDIRTPMNAIVGMTAIAEANIDDTERVRDCLSKISTSSKHLLGLINDVLDMSKIESGNLSLNVSQISLYDIMESLVNMVQPQVKAKNQHFDIFIQEIEAEDVYCDSVRLNQILINLLSNAIKFTPEEGTVHVYLRQEKSPVGDDYVRCDFRVKDNGIGMMPEFQKKIFEQFSREDNLRVERTEGTGLGMAITKCIVDAMEGTIDVQSAPGKGSEFHVVLDLKRAVIREEDMILPNWNMLVVDNNEDLCHSAISALKGMGIDAEWALDGRTAVEMVRKHHEEKNDYEVVLLDWKMPGMNGIETAREIRKYLGEKVPILVISAYDWSDIEEEAREAGVQGFISKPLFKSNLYLGLSQYMTDDTLEDEPEEDKQMFCGKHVLLAEDNDLNWEIAETILSDVGFEIERAENGQICVEKFEQSAIGSYDLILMDIRMPVMNGYEAARAIRTLERPDAGLPIIAMTADAFAEDIQRSLDSGMNEHIAKPLNIEHLIQLLKKYL